MEIRRTALDGCLELRPKIFTDQRGRFVKTFNADEFAAAGLVDDWAEQFWSLSDAGVLRGLHFQVPPSDHAKLVTCLHGEVLDAVVDLRGGSPTYGKHALLTLSAAEGNAIYIPSGFAHGFLVTKGPSIVHYSVSTVHDRDRDAGIRWDSCSIPWPLAQDQKPIVSARDAGFRPFADFVSPFAWARSP